MRQLGLAGSAGNQPVHRFGVDAQDLAAAFQLAAHRNSGPQAQGQGLQAIGIALLGAAKRGLAQFRIEAVQLEKESLLAIGQEIQDGLGAGAGVKIALAEHFAFQAEIFRAPGEPHEWLSHIGRIQVGSNQGQRVRLHHARILSPARAVLVEFLRKLGGHGATRLHQFSRIEGCATGRWPRIKGAAGNHQVESPIEVGIGRAALQLAVRYAKERVVFGRPIGQNQGIQHPLARNWAELEAANHMLLAAADLYDKGLPCGSEANAAKLLASEACLNACRTSILTHGGYGYAKEYHVERFMREAYIGYIAPVTPQLILSNIAERKLGLPKSY